MFEYFSKNGLENSSLTRITGTLREDRYTFMIISRSVLLRMKNISDKICREDQNTHFVFINFFFRKSCLLWYVIWKNMVSQTGHRWQYNTARAHCMLDNWRYKHTLRICTTYCFSTATMVPRKRLIVTSHVLCLYCYIYKQPHRTKRRIIGNFRTDVGRCAKGQFYVPRIGRHRNRARRTVTLIVA